MQVNVAGLRRNIKNLAHNYSDAQVKVREATSNDPWGPSAAIMAEIADLTYNVVAFSEIMQMIWKRLNDHGKNWRHVYKALILLEYLIKTGSEKVAQQCKENIFAIQTLREFVYYEEGKDQGTHVREKAKQLVNLLRDDERLKNERIKALKAKERFAQHPSGFGSDGYIDGPSHRDMPPGWQEDPKPLSELELVRPQTAGEEELQLKLAMAMSREEAEQEEAKRRSDDVRLQLALSQSEQDFKEQTVRPPKKEEQQSHLLDLLDISLGAASISSPPLGAAGAMGGADPWVTPARAASQLSDPWSGTSSPQIDPWQPTAAMRSNTSSVPLGAGVSGAVGTNGDAWALRTQSPSIASGSSTEGWLQTNGAAINGNTNIPRGNAGAGDPWLNKTTAASLVAVQPVSSGLVDPWITDTPKPAPALAPVEKSLSLADPWASTSKADDPWKGLGSTGAIKKISPDLDEFDVISNRNKTGDLLTDDLLCGPNNNITTTETATTNGKKLLKTPQAFLGENSSLVNLDNLIKPVVPQTQSGNAAYNPFSDTVIPPKTNLFQQQQPAVPSINQLKQQQPFSMSVNPDPWAPISNPNAVSQKANLFQHAHESDEHRHGHGLETAKIRYSAFAQSIDEEESVFNKNVDTTQQDFIDYYYNHSSSSNYANKNTNFNSYNNNNNNHNNNNNKTQRSSDSDDDVFNTSYVPYHFLSNPENFQKKNFSYTNNNSISNSNNNNNYNNNNDQFYASTVARTTRSCDNIGIFNAAEYKLPSSTTAISTFNDHANNYSNNNNNVYNNSNRIQKKIYPILDRNEFIDFRNEGAYVEKSHIPSSVKDAAATARGGSLFNYGFYDATCGSNQNYPLSSLNAISSGCNNNNNNMAWMKPDASSSNPFLT